MENSQYSQTLDPRESGLWADGGAPPARIDFELTERCNNRCAHCYINQPADDPAVCRRELPTEAVHDLLDQAAAMGFLSVRFTGGEPLLRPDFETIYVHARRLGMRTILFTNATLISEELAGLLARMPPLAPVEVTLYGLAASSYEAVSRVAGSFEAASRGISLLRKHRVPFLLKGAVLPANEHEIAAFRQWAADLLGPGEAPSFSVFFDLRCRRDSPRRNRMIRALRPKPGRGVAILERTGEGYEQKTRRFCARFIGPPGRRLFKCGAGRGGCIDAYGTYLPCLMLRHPAATCDLRRSSLSEALTKFAPELRAREAQNPEYLRRCARCFLHGLCEQCPGRAWTESGTLDTPVEYCCAVAHEQARRIGLLNTGENAWEIRDWRNRLSRIEDSDGPA